MQPIQRFNTFEDFQVAHLSQETTTIWTVGDIYTDETKSQYKRVTFKCVHDKKEEAIKSRGNCNRPNQQYQAKGCEAVIKENVYEVRLINNNHNHDVNEQLYKMYMQTRKLTEAEEKEASELIQSGGDANKIAERMSTKTEYTIFEQSINTNKTTKQQTKSWHLMRS
jgi:hypothetical protein